MLKKGFDNLTIVIIGF